MDVDRAEFVIVDTETTGSRAGEDRLIEIGAARLVGGEVVETFQQLIDPGRHVPRRITRLTGISTGMVYGQPSASEVMPRFVEFLGDAVLVAHNLPFDARFLDVALAEAGLPPLQNPSLDTLRLARRLLSSLPSKGLSKLTQHFGITVNGRHRALGDAVATAELLVILMERMRLEFGVTTVEGVLDFQRRRYKDTRREPGHLKKIREQTLPLLPDRPGVYFMRDTRGSVIYVGKAKSLRNRVRSYFSAVDAHDPKTRKLVRDVRAVDWRETGTELAALLEESRLIKNYLPVYNRAQRRYRDYPFLRLDATHAFPTISWTPRIAHDGAEYYGPLGRRGQAEEMVELINRLFRLRECDDNVFGLGRPCLYAEMGRCGAPCVDDGGAEPYGVEVERVRAFLTGQDTEAVDVVEEAMREAAAVARVRGGRVVPRPAPAAPADDGPPAPDRVGRPRAPRRPGRAPRAGLRRAPRGRPAVPDPPRPAGRPRRPPRRARAGRGRRPARGAGGGVRPVARAAPVAPPPGRGRDADAGELDAAERGRRPRPLDVRRRPGRVRRGRPRRRAGRLRQRGRGVKGDG